MTMDDGVLGCEDVSTLHESTKINYGALFAKSIKLFI